MRPLLLRPPFFVSFSVSAFSGFVFVTSSKVETVMKRRPGDVGLYFLSAISGHRLSRSCSLPAKSKQRNGARAYGAHESVRSRRLRARLRPRRCAALQPRSECEMGRWGPPSNLSSLEDLDRISLAQLHDRLLPARLLAPMRAA